MNRNLLRIGLAVATAGAVVTTTVVAAQGNGGRGSGGDRDNRVSARLTGYNETPSTLSSPARGAFRATIDREDREVRYSLSFGGTPTSVIMAHIHFGRAGLSGGISVWLCDNTGNGPAGTQACPASGTVTGTATADNVVGPAGQGIAAGEFDELVKAIKRGAAYVNVHTTQYQGGEIRGQLR